MKNKISLTVPLLLIANTLLAETFVLNSSLDNLKTEEKLVRDNKKEVVYDPNTNLLWQDNKQAKTLKKTWQGSTKHCDALVFGGYSDWRLPTITELKSIVDYTKDNPAIKNGFKNVVSDFYWTSSPNVADSSGTWVVNFSYGNDFLDGKSYSFLVRCVRDSD
jgi:hypothetical protein